MEKDGMPAMHYNEFESFTRSPTTIFEVFLPRIQSMTSPQFQSKIRASSAYPSDTAAINKASAE
ncbi:hypothetical protein CAter282_3175 [Collimonas arenae]|uniref:Uncharacterized protein n=1 Tax=Collimonas arenae TaxID=279058 RepID=A0A127QLE2_9BURK|nr:hypothetical protein CAter10_3484 [Collimonas arenae]AMP10880.1 hypothetical protein CAter282_3175 [Collimonas arenae]